MAFSVHTVSKQEGSISLVDYLARIRHCSLRKAKALVDTRTVFVNQQRVWMARHVLHPGDCVEIRMPDQTAPQPLPLLFENRLFLVVNKPAGLLSNGPDSAEVLARTQFKQQAVEAVHRLDRDTSGCLCLARSPDAFERAVALFKGGQVHKSYQALVAGRVQKQEGQIRHRLEGQTAVTHWRVLSANDIASHVSITIDTGRTHQIRKHFGGIGHPVLGDRIYLTGRLDEPRLRAIPRQMLHAVALEAPLGPKGEQARVQAPIPRDFQAALKNLRLH